MFFMQIFNDFEAKRSEMKSGKVEFKKKQQILRQRFYFGGSHRLLKPKRRGCPECEDPFFQLHKADFNLVYKMNGIAFKYFFS